MNAFLIISCTPTGAIIVHYGTPGFASASPGDNHVPPMPGEYHLIQIHICNHISKLTWSESSHNPKLCVQYISRILTLGFSEKSEVPQTPFRNHNSELRKHTSRDNGLWCDSPPVLLHFYAVLPPVGGKVISPGLSLLLTSFYHFFQFTIPSFLITYNLKYCITLQNTKNLSPKK